MQGTECRPTLPAGQWGLNEVSSEIHSLRQVSEHGEKHLGSKSAKVSKSRNHTVRGGKQTACRTYANRTQRLRASNLCCNRRK